jgi:hypothetical protein
MRNVLVLESKPSIFTKFVGNLSDHHIVQAETADVAIALLEEYDWDWLFLDYTQGIEVEMEHNAPYVGGNAIGRWLIANPERNPSHVVAYNIPDEDSITSRKQFPDVTFMLRPWSLNLTKIEREVMRDRRERQHRKFSKYVYVYG